MRILTIHTFQSSRTSYLDEDKLNTKIDDRKCFLNKRDSWSPYSKEYARKLYKVFG